MLDIIRNSSPPFPTLGNKAVALLRLHLASEQKRIEVFINSPPEAHKFFKLFLKRINVPNTKQISLCTRQALLCSQSVEVNYTKHWNEMPIPVTLALENQELFFCCCCVLVLLFLFETGISPELFSKLLIKPHHHQCRSSHMTILLIQGNAEPFPIGLRALQTYAETDYSVSKWTLTWWNLLRWRIRIAGTADISSCFLALV